MSAAAEGSPTATRRWLAFAAVPLVGLLAFVLPSLVSPPPREYPAPLFPWLRAAVETVGLPALLMLVLAGALAGTLCPLKPVPLGMYCVALLPVAAILEIVADPTSHSMIPFELGMYAVFGLVAAAGVAAARWVRARWTAA